MSDFVHRRINKYKTEAGDCSLRPVIGYTVACILIFATALVGFGQTSLPAVSEHRQGSLTENNTAVSYPAGEPLSDFFQYLGEEDPLRDYLSDRTGWMLLDFWASWCRPCIRHQADIKREKEGFFDVLGVKIVSISVQESPQMSRRSHANRELPWETFPDVSGQFARALKATSIPQYVLVNQDGVIHGVYTNAAAVKSALQTRINAQSQRDQ